MAKLVDALCSGRSARKGVLVRIQFWAPGLQLTAEGFFIGSGRLSDLSLNAHNIHVKLI